MPAMPTMPIIPQTQYIIPRQASGGLVLPPVPVTAPAAPATGVSTSTVPPTPSTTAAVVDSTDDTRAKQRLAIKQSFLAGLGISWTPDTEDIEREKADLPKEGLLHPDRGALEAHRENTRPHPMKAIESFKPEEKLVAPNSEAKAASEVDEKAQITSPQATASQKPDDTASETVPPSQDETEQA